MEKDKTPGIEEPVNENVRPVKKVNKIGNFFHNIIIGEYFVRDSFFRNIPYLGYLTILAIIYISNSYYAEKTFLQIETINKEMKEIKFHYISSRSELMFHSRQTEIAKRVIKTGLHASPVPPYKIFYDKDTLKTIIQEEDQP